MFNDKPAHKRFSTKVDLLQFLPEKPRKVFLGISLLFWGFFGNKAIAFAKIMEKMERSEGISDKS